MACAQAVRDATAGSVDDEFKRAGSNFGVNHNTVNDIVYCGRGSSCFDFVASSSGDRDIIINTKRINTQWLNHRDPPVLWTFPL